MKWLRFKINSVDMLKRNWDPEWCEYFANYGSDRFEIVRQSTTGFIEIKTPGWREGIVYIGTKNMHECEILNLPMDIPEEMFEI